MTKRKPISDADLQAIIRAEIADADGQANSQLSIERGENMDYYQGQPFGNEIEGRSSVVSSDVRDTIEWILPTLIRIFCSGENAVEFEPEQPSDTDAAKQATEYVNFIWNRDNRGFVNTYSWFKDALLQKNGVLKIWWDDTPQSKRERYSGLDDGAFTYLVADPAVSVAEHSETVTPIEVIGIDPATGAPAPQRTEIKTHDLVLTRKIPGGRVCVMPVPPEEFLISRDARDIAGARFVGHRRRRAVSDLIAEGYSRALVENLAGDETSIMTDAEEIARSAVNNSARQNMADLRAMANDLLWFQYGKGDGPAAHAYGSATSTTVSGADVTAVYHAGRRIKAVGSSTGTIYGSVASSSFSTNTTINYTWDSGSLANETLTIYLSQVPVTGKPIPAAAVSGLSTTLPTRQVLTSGTGATYTTPAGCRQLRIRMVGGGGGGGGAFGGSAGGAGGDTSFNSIVAKGGAAGGGDINMGAVGGSGGSGSASYRARGGAGAAPALNFSAVTGGNGGNSAFGAGALGAGGSAAGSAAGANTGAGGGGGGNTSQTVAGAGGGGGEYVELIISSPGTTYSYSIGAGGTAGAGGEVGGAGGSGVIIVDEFY